jgi:hypothetical protein
MELLRWVKSRILILLPNLANARSDNELPNPQLSSTDMPPAPITAVLPGEETDNAEPNRVTALTDMLEPRWRKSKMLAALPILAKLLNDKLDPSDIVLKTEHLPLATEIFPEIEIEEDNREKDRTDKLEPRDEKERMERLLPILE